MRIPLGGKHFLQARRADDRTQNPKITEMGVFVSPSFRSIRPEIDIDLS